MVCKEKEFLLCELSLAYSGIDSAKTFGYAESALELFQLTSSPYGVGQAYLSLAGGHLNYNDLTQAKAYAYFSKSGKLYQGSMAISQFIQDRFIFSLCLYSTDSLARTKEVLA